MFKNKKCLVLGLGRSGKAAIRLLEYFGADITINDASPKEKIPEYDSYIEKGMRVICGGQPEELFEEDFDYCIKVPGINYHAPFVLRLKERGIPVLTEIELGYMVAKPQNYIAITGTNGKTTTVSLIYSLLKGAGHNVHICGNYGIPYCDVVMDEKLYEVSNHDIVVEMSNFQLLDIHTFRPHISCVMNLTPDHLDYMDSLDEYYASKMRIYMNTDKNDIFIINDDDQTLKGYLERYPVPASTETISLVRQADCQLIDNTIYYKGQKVIDRDDIQIVGIHNVCNIMIGIVSAIHCGLDIETIKKGIMSFKAVEHRIEYVDTIKGVKYYNDSKGTNVDATVIAIKAFEQPVILLIGGYEKDLDLKEMSLLNDRISTLITYGATRERFARDMHHPHTFIEETMEDAVKKAYSISQSGDVVLLSPSTSSFDEFDNYEQRGRVFKDIVHQLGE